MRILIADPLRDQRALLRAMCRGYWVKEVSHSTEALSKAKDFDVILTEVGFPGLGGQDYLDQLRRKTTAKIIVVTAYRENFDADVVFHKPIYTGDVINAILSKT